MTHELLENRLYRSMSASPDPKTSETESSAYVVTGEIPTENAPSQPTVRFVVMSAATAAAPVPASPANILPPVSTSSPELKKMYDDIQAINRQTRISQASPNPDEKALILRAASEKYNLLQQAETSQLADVMKAANAMMEKAGDVTGPASQILGNADLIAKYIKENGLSNFEKLLSARLTELVSAETKTKLTPIADAVGNVDKIIGAIGLVRDLRAAADPSNPGAIAKALGGMIGTIASLLPTIPGVSDILGHYADALKKIGDVIDGMMGQEAQENVDSLRAGDSPLGRAAVWGLQWAKDFCDHLGIDWKTEYPGSYR